MRRSTRRMRASLSTLGAGLRIAQASAVGDRLAAAQPTRIIGAYPARAHSVVSKRFLRAGFYRLRYRSQTPAVLSITPQTGLAFSVAPPRAIAILEATESPQYYSISPSD